MFSPKVIFTACLLISSILTFAQVSTNTGTIPPGTKDSTAFEIEASYPGGAAAWIKFLQKNLKSDVPIKNDAPIGRFQAIVLFIVDKDGSVSNVKPVTRLGYGMEEEVARVIEMSGKWTPATRNGIPLKAYRKQPITFLNESADFEIVTREPFTLFANADNEITVTAKKVKPEAIAINVRGGKATRLSDGKFMVRINKVGRISIEVVNNKKDDKLIGVASFEVLAN